MESKTWVVVANSSRARIFRVESKDTLQELDSLVHDESRLREGDMVSDRKGRSFNRFGWGRHALEQEVPHHQREAMHFAHDLAHHLKHSWDEGKFSRLYLAAGPRFLGILREVLDSHVTKAIASEINKDLTELTLPQIREHLPYIL
jgi:protein required for attachment to host cells